MDVTQSKLLQLKIACSQSEYKVKFMDFSLSLPQNQF